MDIDCNKNHDEFVSLLRASKRPGIEQLVLGSLSVSGCYRRTLYSV